MGHDLAMRTAMAAGLGLVAAAGNLLGGHFVVRKDWPRQYLQYFLALGAGYMLAVGFFSTIPELLQLAGHDALFFLLAGFFLGHPFQHMLRPALYFGAVTHIEEMS